MTSSGFRTKALMKQLCSLRRLHSDSSRGLPAASHIVNVKACKVVPKQPTIVTTEGKWVELEGHSTPLINFASKDVFGIQNTPLLDHASVNHKPTAHSSAENNSSVQKYLGNALAFLHSKDDAALTSQSFDITLNSWLRHMVGSGHVVHVPEACSLVQSGVGAMQRYACMEDLEKQLIEERQESGKHSLVLVEAGATKRSIQHLKDLCYTAEKQFATVVLLDPEGLGLIRCAIGDNEETLRILRRPAIIFTTLDPLTSSYCVCYLAGSRKHIELSRQACDKQWCTVDEQAAQNIIMALQLLRHRSHKFYTTALHSTSLKLQLESAHTRVRDHGTSLSVVLERVIAEDINQQLKQKGFHVSLKYNQAHEAELYFSVSGHHDYSDVAHFSQALITLLRHHNVILKDDVIKPMPKISLGCLDQNGDDPQIHEIISYDQVVKSERAVKKYAAEHLQRHNTEFAMQRKFNDGQKINKKSLTELSRKVFGFRTGVRNYKSYFARNVDFDYDIRLLSQVYCKTERDIAADTNLRENLMWAPIMCPEETTESTKSDAHGHYFTVQDYKKLRSETDYRYLLDLYCTPMFDDLFVRNLAQQL